MNRRTAIGTLGALATAATTFAQTPPTVHRTAPMLCLYSQSAIKVPYPELGNIAGQIGFEGVDLTVFNGGHVDPHLMNVDLVRAFETIRDASLDVPMISTEYGALNDGTVYPVFYLSGHSNIPLVRLGYWPYGSAPIESRLMQVRAEFNQYLQIAQRCNMTVMLPNRAGDYVGEATWDFEEILRGVPAALAGYYFDPSQALAEGGLGGWEAAFRLALPRLKAIAIQDFYWAKTGGAWKMQMCPLGQGMVDWKKFFSMAAAAGFTGPISIHMQYGPKDEVGSMARDLEFARAQVKAAWHV